MVMLELMFVEKGKLVSLKVNVQLLNVMNKVVIWFFKNEDKVMVDQSGNVIGVEVGIVMIEIVFKDGSKKGIVMVEVIVFVVVVIGVEIDLNSIIVEVNKIVQLIVNVESVGVINKIVIWEFKNIEFVMVDSEIGVVIGVVVGIVIIEVII